MTFVNSTEMKIDLPPDQAEMLSTKENIKIIIRENPDTVMAFDIMDHDDLVGFVLVHRFEERKYFLWDTPSISVFKTSIREPVLSLNSLII